MERRGAVARSFKNGQAGSAEEALASLAAVGLLVRTEKDGIALWREARR